MDLEFNGRERIIFIEYGYIYIFMIVIEFGTSSRDVVKYGLGGVDLICILRRFLRKCVNWVDFWRVCRRGVKEEVTDDEEGEELRGLGIELICDVGKN